MPYILGARMCRVKQINTETLTHYGPYREVYLKSADRQNSKSLPREIHDSDRESHFTGVKIQKELIFPARWREISPFWKAAQSPDR